MKKIKLLLAAMAAMVGMSANAQTWSGNEVAEGSFYLYNVGTGQWLCAANDWGTHASIGSVGLDYKLAGSNGVYTIDSNVSNGGDSHYLIGDWNDGAATNFTFTKVADNPITYTIQNGDNYLGYTGNGTFAGNVTTKDTNAHWILVTKADLIANLANATAQNPINATFFIEDANFGRNDLRKSYWTMEAGNQNLSGGNNVNNCAESWHSTFTLSQSLTGLPAGVYGLKAQGFFRQDGSDYDDLPYFYVNDEKITFVEREANGPNSMSACSESFAAGNFTSKEAIIRYDGGDFVVGAKLEANTALWCIWDNFQLYYYGDCTVDEAKFSALIIELNQLIASAKNEAETLAIPTAAAAELKSAAEGIEADMASFTTEGEYNNAITALNTAIDDAKALVAPKHLFDLALTKAEAALQLQELAAADKTNLQNAIPDVNTCKTVAEIEAMTADLWTAIIAAVDAIEVEGDDMVDLTFLLTNPDLSKVPTWQPAEGWYNDQNQPTQNSQAMDNVAVANKADNSLYYFYEYWSNSTEPTDGYVVYQKVTLPEGTYKMTALAYAGFGGGHQYGYQTDGDHSLGPKGEGAPNITFSAGDIDGSPIQTTTLEDASIDFIQETAGEVKIGLKAHENNRSNWMGIGYVQLFKVATKEPVIIDENVDYVAESAAADAILKRTFKADVWNTFVVPFQITNEELKAAFGDEVAVATFEETANGDFSHVDFNTMATPAIQANTPVLIKTAETAVDLTFKNRTIAGGEVLVQGANYNFVGTYAASTTIKAGDYFLSGEKLYKSAGTTTIKGTRAYFVAKAGAPAEVKVCIDGITTRINGINGAAENGAIYNLAGQRVNNAQKGIFIVNGNKVVK